MTQVALWDSFPPGFLPDWLNDSAWKGKETGLYPFEGSSTDWDSLLQNAVNFSTEMRSILVSVIQKQSNHWLSSAQKQSLQILSQTNAFTVTTGQQLHFDLGPAYVFFKITSAISLANDLQLMYPNYRFVPLFWMASEDHDFQEISTSQLFNQTWNWEKNDAESGAVGRLSTQSLIPWLNWLRDFFNNNQEALQELAVLEQNIQSNTPKLADFVQSWILRIFENTPLLVVNPDSQELKQRMVPLFMAEIEHGIVQELVEKQNRQLLAKSLSPEAYVRRCNLFYLTDHLRDRMEVKEGVVTTVTSGRRWSMTEIETELREYPQRFSPNVLFRPLYQQTILPNIAYIAGPSEFKYWLQIPEALKFNGLIQPSLVLRKSGIFLSLSLHKKLKKWDLSVWDMFALNEKELQHQMLTKINQQFVLDQDLTELQNRLESIYTQLYMLKSESLKGFKQQGDKLVSELGRVVKSERELLLNRGISAAEWHSIQQLQSTIANQSAPQERRFHWIQQYFKSIENFKSMIDVMTHPDAGTGTHHSSPSGNSQLPYFQSPFLLVVE